MAARPRLAIARYSASARALLRVIVVVFVAFLTSGVAHAYVEANEDEDSACTESESAETPDHDEGEGPSCPDDCVGPAHHCSCCSNLVVTFTPSMRVAPAAVRSVDRVPSSIACAAVGVRSRIERPPRP